MTKQETTDNDSLNNISADNCHINHLDCGLPQWLLTLGFILMVMAAVCTVSALDSWFREQAPLALAAINTVGMLIMYFAAMLGMKPLYRPLTWWWGLVIALNIVSFASISLGALWPEVDFIIACALPLAYLPLGILIAIWYHGQLQHLGIWMIVRILTVFLLPIAWFMLGWGMNSVVMQGIIVLVELIYAWLLYRILR